MDVFHILTLDNDFLKFLSCDMYWNVIITSFVLKMPFIGHIEGESAGNPDETLVSSVSIREEGVSQI